MNSKISILFLFIASLTIPLDISHGDETSNIVTNAAKGWSLLENSRKNLSFDFVTSRDDIKHDPSTNNYASDRTEAFFLDNNVLFRKSFSKDNGKDSQFIACKNRHYSFRIAKSESSDSWELIDLDLRDQSHTDIPFDTDAIDVVLAPWSILGIPLRLIVSDPTFHLLSSSTEKDGDEKEVTIIEFELRSNTGFAIMDQLRKCKARLLSQQNYAVDSFEAHFEDEKEKSHFDCKGKCHYNFEEVPLALKSYDYTLFRDKGSIKTITWTTTFSNISPCSLQHSDFMMSAYGFAEPFTPASRGNRIRIAFIAAGIILICVGLYLRRQGNKA